MSVIPQVYNQGTGLIGSATEGQTLPTNVQDLVVEETLTVLGETTLNGDVQCNTNVNIQGTLTVPIIDVELINIEDLTVVDTLTVQGTVGSGPLTQFELPGNAPTAGDVIVATDNAGSTEWRPLNNKLQVLTTPFSVTTQQFPLTDSLIGTGGQIIGGNALPNNIQRGDIITVQSYGTQLNLNNGQFVLVLTVGNASVQVEQVSIDPHDGSQITGFRIDTQICFLNIGATGVLSYNIFYTVGDLTTGSNLNQGRVWSGTLSVDTTAGGVINLECTSNNNLVPVTFDVNQALIRRS